MKPGLKQQQKPVPQPPPLSFAQMKKTILAQMAQVQEDDLDIMSVEEITVFYHELLASQGQQVRQACIDNGTWDGNRNEELVEEMFQAEQLADDLGDHQNRFLQEKKQQCHYEFDSPSDAAYNQNPSKSNLIQQQVQQTPIITIDNKQYYKPQWLSHPLYNSTNNRFRIMLKPLMKTPQQRKQAVLLAKHPKMSKQIKKMTNKEIKQVYDMMRIPDQKQQYLLGKSKTSKLEIVEFCVYITKCEVEDNIKLKGQPQSLRKQLKQKEDDKSKQKNHKIEDKKTRSKRFVDQAQQDLQFQRVSRSSSKRQKSNIKNTKLKNTQKYSMQQQYQQHKSLQQPRKPKKVTILTYTEQQYQQQSNIQPPTRTRAEQFPPAMQLPRKLNLAQLQQAFVNPNHTSRSIALEWIRNLKGIVTELEKYYSRSGDEEVDEDGQSVGEKDRYIQTKDEHQNKGFQQQAASILLANDKQQKKEI